MGDLEIKGLQRQQSDVAGGMPQYRCHKKVWALKISHIHITPELPGAQLVVEDKGFAPIQATEEWMKKHSPQAGGYYVIYEDGYKSYSPAKAFEEGYTRI